MNENFQRLSQRLFNKEIETSEFLAELRAIGEFKDELFDVLKKLYDEQDPSNLAKFLWAVSLVQTRNSHRCFAS
jgi:hypothetical protein